MGAAWTFRGGCLKVKENEVFTPCTLDVQFVLTADVFQHKIHDVTFGGVVFSLRFFVINVFDWKQNQKNQNCLIDVWVNVRDIVCFFL